MQQRVKSFSAYLVKNKSKVNAGARKGRKFEEIFRPGRRHSKPMQNLRVQSTAENLIGFVSLPGQKLSSNLPLQILQGIKYTQCSLYGLDAVNALRLFP